MPDNLLVNRNGQTYQVDMTNTKAIEATDLLLVNRNGTTYTVTGDQISQAQFETVTLAPLSGTPNFEATAVTDISSIPDGATARYRWYRYDDATTDAGKTLLQDRVLTTTSDTYEIVATEQEKFVGCTVTYLGASVSETQRIQCETADVPIARMNGIRFDGDRDTYFSRPIVGQVKTYTISFWMKPTDLSNARPYAVGLGSVSDPAFFAYFNPPDVTATGGKMTVYHGSSVQSYRLMTEEIPLNEWTHVVISYNASEQTMRVYLNGQDPEVFTSFGAPVDLASGDDYYIVGSATDGGGHYNGYMTDFYFVNERALTPETFGQQFLLGWGPLDKSTVLDNIEYVEVPTDPLSPADTAPNMAQKWSDGITGDAGNKGNAFDGNINTACDSATSGGVETETLTAALGITLNNETVELFAGHTYSGFYVTIDGVKQPTEYATTEKSKLFGPFTGTLTSVSINNGTDISNRPAGLAAVKVGNRMLVDGPADNTRVWSADATCTGNSNDNIGNRAQNLNWLTLAFDGLIGTAYGPSRNDSTLSVPISPPISGELKVSASIGEGNGTQSGIRIWENGAATTFVNTDTLGFGSGFISEGTVGTFTNITQIDFAYIGGNSGFYISQLKLDDVILVDIPQEWNTNQIWSQSINPADVFTGSNPEGIYSGALTPDVAGTYTNFTADGRTVTLYDGPGILGTTSSSTVEFYTNVVDQGGALVITINGTAVSLDTTPDGSQWTWQKVTPGSWSGEITSITISDNGYNAYGIAAVKVDGKILVDGPPIWNTSRVWSNGGKDNQGLYAGCEWDHIFNGSIPEANSLTAANTATTNGTVPATLNFDPPLSGKLEIMAGTDTNTGGSSTIVELSDGTQITVNVTNGAFTWFSFGEVTNITSLTICAAGSANGCAAVAMKLNDELLVDAGSFGDNGFFLPFDPEEGYMYSNTATISNGQLYGSPNDPPSAFDGILTNANFMTCANNGGSTIATFTFDPPIGNGTTDLVEIYWYNAGNVTVFPQLNGSNLTDAAHEQWYDCGSQVRSVGVTHNAGSGAVGVFGMRLNGKLLLDNGGIGYDGSGNENYFKPINFSAGNSSQIWSGPDKFTTDGTFRSGYLPQKAFNGYDSIYDTAETQDGSYILLDISDNPIPASNLVIRCAAGGGPKDVVVNGNANTTTSFTNVEWTTKNVPLDTETEIRTIRWGAPMAIVWIKVNGEYLIDGNIQDTVLDTPIDSYSVLYATSGSTSNGRLNSSDGGVDKHYHYGLQPLDNTKKYYAEFTAFGADFPGVGVTSDPTDTTWAGRQVLYWNGNYGAGSGNDILTGKTWNPAVDVIGVAYEAGKQTFFKNGEFLYEASLPDATATHYFTGVTSTQANKYQVNFGQQMFAGSNIIDNDNGTVTINSTIPNTSQVWSDGKSGGWTNSATNMFDGDLTTSDYKTELGATAVVTFTGLTAKESIRVYGSDSASPGSWKITLDNVATPIWPESTTNAWTDVPFDGEVTVNSISNDAWSGNVYAIEIDGRILVDGDPTQDTSEKWSQSLTCDAGFFSGYGPEKMFDGDVDTYMASSNAAVENGIPAIWVAPSEITVSTSIRMKAQGKVTAISGGTETVIYNNGNFTEFTVPSSSVSAFDSIKFEPVGGSGFNCAFIEIDGKTYVDSTSGFPGGVYRKVYKTWSEQKGVVFQARIAAADLLMTALRNHAQSYSATEDYCEGTVISAFGQLWISVADAQATAFADKTSLLAHPNWEQLNVSV